MIKAIIVDDEYKLSEVLKSKLESYCPQVEVIGEAKTVDDAVHLISENNIDLLFLDITLMDGETGFDIIERIQNIQFEIIFITAYSEYALDALKLSATDYLLKPVANEELILAVNKAIQKINHKEMLDNFSVLKHNLKTMNNSKVKIVIPGTSSKIFVKAEDIIRFEGWDKYTKTYTTNGEVFLSSYNIGIFKKLVQNLNFFQTHKSHIVNEEHIKEFNTEGFIVMTNGDNVPVARRKKDSFLEKFVRN